MTNEKKNGYVRYISAIFIAVTLLAILTLAVGNGGAEKSGSDIKIEYHLSENSDIPESTAPRAVTFTPPPRHSSDTKEEAQVKNMSVAFVSTVMMGAFIIGIAYLFYRKKTIDMTIGTTGFFSWKTLLGSIAGFLLLLLMMVMVTQVSATTYHVKEGATGDEDGSSEANAFVTIQDGVDATSPYDTVLVHTGTYSENVDIIGPDHYDITVIVDTNEIATINGGGAQDSYCMATTVNGVTIQGFEMMNADYGIYIDFGGELIIESNTITGCESGIYAYSCILSDFNYNICGANGQINYYGITLTGNSHSNVLRENVCNWNIVDTVGWGIGLDYAHYNDLIDNECSNNYDGIYLEDASYNTIDSTVDEGCTYNQRYGSL